MRFHETPPTPDTVADQEAIVLSHIEQLMDEDQESPVMAVGESIRYGAGGSTESWVCKMMETNDGFELVEYKADEEHPMFTTKISRKETDSGTEWTTTLIRNRWKRFSPEPIVNDLSPFMGVLKHYFAD